MRGESACDWDEGAEEQKNCRKDGSSRRKIFSLYGGPQAKQRALLLLLD
jgi:hypothetical protein